MPLGLSSANKRRRTGPLSLHNKLEALPLSDATDPSLFRLVIGDRPELAAVRQTSGSLDDSIWACKGETPFEVWLTRTTMGQLTVTLKSTETGPELGH